MDMQRIKKTIKITFLIILITALNIGTQAIELIAKVDTSKIGIEDKLIYNITVKKRGGGSVPQPVPPAFKNFDVAGRSSTQNMSIINGKISLEYIVHFTLVPIKTGKFTIPPAALKINGKVIKSNPVTVEVVNGSIKPKRQSAYRQRRRHFPTFFDDDDFFSPFSRRDPFRIFRRRPRNFRQNTPDYFVELIPDKREAYVGEQIILTFKFYYKGGFFNSPQYNLPKLTDFWVESLSDEANSVEIRNGTSYRVSKVKTAIFPISKGEKNIGSATITFVEDPFAGPQKLATRPFKIKVKDLPQPAPPGFSYAVGQFNMEVNLDKLVVPANESVSLSIKIYGKGSLKPLKNISLPPIKGIDIYEGKKSSTTYRGGMITETKIFEYILVPASPGNYKIPPIKFIYFDPQKKKYITKTSNEFTLKVTQPLKNTKSFEDRINIYDREDVTLLDSSIRYIKTLPPKNFDHDFYIYSKLWFKLSLVLPFIFFVICYIVRKLIDKYLLDPSYMRLVRAKSKAMSLLAKVKKHTKKEGFEIITKALCGYIADKLNTTSSNVDKDTAIKLLEQNNVSSELLKQIEELLDLCNFARFGMGDIKLSPYELKNKAISLIKSLAKELK